MSQIKTMLKKVLTLLENPKRVDDGWIESNKARELFGISKRTWQNWRDRRVIPFVQFERKIYVKKADVDAFMMSHMIGKGGEQ